MIFTNYVRRQRSYLVHEGTTTGGDAHVLPRAALARGDAAKTTSATHTRRQNVPSPTPSPILQHGVGAHKEGAEHFLFHPETQSLICKSYNTPNYQVNMAILYGRWKEVQIWFPMRESVDARSRQLERDARHIDIISKFNSCIHL